MENLGDMSLMGENYEDGLMMGGKAWEDEVDYSDNYDVGSANDQLNAVEERSSNRKKHHRHTAYQIQELENAFKENPHPDEKARLELGRKLNLEGRQVKFWFQNRRTQMKTQLERHENSMLKQENDKLRIENMTMKDAMRNPICESCGSPAILGEISIEQHHLMIENARLKDELSRVSVLANKFLGSGCRGNDNPMLSQPAMMSDGKLDLAIGRNSLGGFDPSVEFGYRFPSATLPLSAMPPNVDFPFDKSLLLNLALSASDELLKLGQVDGPMWFRSVEGDVEMLNLEEYAKSFSPSIGNKPSHLVAEATRASGTVILNGPTLVEAFMDVNQWTEMFPGNIGWALTVSAISSGGNKSGTLLLMQAEFIAFSAMVPLRRVKFIRFCKQHRDDMWAVVDLSVDFLFHGGNEGSPFTCRRLPSGCIIQDLSNGCSKVIWIEHTEYDETNVPHICRPMVRCGLAFGAPKWLANLRRQCELFATVMSSSNDGHSALPPNGKRSIVKLAQRMTRSFCLGISGTVHDWETVQNADDVRMMIRKSAGGDSGEPSGVILSATNTIWMPLSPKNLLEFLQDESNRHLWDVLCKEGPVEKMLHFPKSREDSGNAISLLHENATDASSSQDVFILQDTCSDASGSLVVYAAVEAVGMNAAMNGGDVSSMAILPSGFSIVPDCFLESNGGSNEGSHGNGSLLTVGFQILANSSPGDKLMVESVDTVKSLIAQTIQGIKANLRCN